MMATKMLMLLSCVVAAVMCADEKYTDKYDNIDIQEILGNKRLLHSYFDCIMERGKCTAEGKELKDHMVDAIETGCKKCTEAQEKGAATIIEHLIANEREIWNELCAKFDPTGKWRKEYEDRAKAKGISIPEE